MAQLPSRPDLEQARRQAKELLRAAHDGDAEATARIAAVSDRQTLAGARLALAREHGFPSWVKLTREIERREILDNREADRLAALLAEEPELATAPMRRWRDHGGGPSPLSYTAMLRYDTADGVWRDLPDTGPLARLLLQAGAPADGGPDDSETPLITAASYGDAEVARALIEAGADLEARASDDAGGVPGGTAIRSGPGSIIVIRSVSDAPGARSIGTRSGGRPVTVRTRIHEPGCRRAVTTAVWVAAL